MPRPAPSSPLTQRTRLPLRHQQQDEGAPPTGPFIITASPLLTSAVGDAWLVRYGYTAGVLRLLNDALHLTTAEGDFASY